MLLLLMYPAWGDATVGPSEPPYYQPFGGPKSEYFDWTPIRKKQARERQIKMHRELSALFLLME